MGEALTKRTFNSELAPPTAYLETDMETSLHSHFSPADFTQSQLNFAMRLDWIPASDALRWSWNFLVEKGQKVGNRHAADSEQQSNERFFIFTERRQLKPSPTPQMCST